MITEPDPGIEYVPTGSTFIYLDRYYPADSWAAWKKRALILQRMVNHLEHTVEGLDARLLELEDDNTQLRNNREERNE